MTDDSSIRRERSRRGDSARAESEPRWQIDAQRWERSIGHDRAKLGERESWPMIEQRRQSEPSLGID